MSREQESPGELWTDGEERLRQLMVRLEQGDGDGYSEAIEEASAEAAFAFAAAMNRWIASKGIAPEDFEGVYLGACCAMTLAEKIREDWAEAPQRFCVSEYLDCDGLADCEAVKRDEPCCQCCGAASSETQTHYGKGESEVVWLCEPCGHDFARGELVLTPFGQVVRSSSASK